MLNLIGYCRVSRNKPDLQTQLWLHQTWRFDVQQGYAADMRKHIVMTKPAD